MAKQTDTSEVCKGFKILIDGQPYNVLERTHNKPGKGRATTVLRTKNLLTGAVIERTFTSGAKLDLADTEEKQMRLSYVDTTSTEAVFMDEKTYETLNIHLDTVGETKAWLVDDRIYKVLFYNSNAVAVEAPTFMEMKIIQSDPGAKGNTAQGNVKKPATLESGAVIQVPIFVEQGESIIVDTRTGTFESRAKTK